MTRPIASVPELKRLWNEGATLAQIRDHFGYACIGSVSGLVRRNALPKRNPVGETGQRNADIREGRDNGMSLAELCKAYSLSESRIKSILQAGPKRPPPPNVRRIAFSASPAAIRRAADKRGVRL